MRIRSLCALASAVLAHGVLLTAPAVAQTFVRITDPTNPIVTDTGPSFYTGASWVDYDGDGDLDLFVNNDALYRNEGGGAFVRVSTAIGAGVVISAGNGNSWADYDNDGDLDVFTSGRASSLYQNQDDGTFVKVTTGDIGESVANRGWSCAWADIDNDGNVDLMISHPCGFVAGGCIPNRVLINDGPPLYTFTRQDTGVIVTGLAPYTVGSWSDFDLDGDQDLFIGSGPASVMPATDNLYRNLLSETGVAFFERITESPIATDLVDGQLWNWIDIDNDRDLDAYLTNWGGGGSVQRNNLYRNDGGSYSRITTGNIVTDANISLSSLWGDFDNDGDLDCHVTNDSGQSDTYYRNNGNGTFTRTFPAPTMEALTHRGATAGDYDGDGDLDLFLVGPTTATRLYRNDLSSANAWLVVSTVGTVSNRSGIGALVQLKATLGGEPTWQMRQISSQNTFNGHNMLDAHFGLRDASIIDSLIITWPSGIEDVATNVSIDQRVTAVEGQGIGVVSVSEPPATDGVLTLYSAAPNPFQTSTRISFGLARETHVELSVFDLGGRLVTTLIDETRGPGRYDTVLYGAGLGSGMYFYRLRAGDDVRRGRLLRLR